VHCEATQCAVVVTNQTVQCYFIPYGHIHGKLGRFMVQSLTLSSNE